MLASGYADVLDLKDGFTFIPPTTTCCLLSTPSPSLRLIGGGPKTPCPGLLNDTNVLLELYVP
jgi:hypothetical protein